MNMRAACECTCNNNPTIVQNNILYLICKKRIRYAFVIYDIRKRIPVLKLIFNKYCINIEFIMSQLNIYLYQQTLIN